MAAIALAGLTRARPAAAIVHADADDADEAVVALVPAGTNLTFCTATLVAPDVVLTAAHCVSPWASIDVLVGGGAGKAPRRIAALEAAVDPAFDPSSLEADLALVVLERPVDAGPLALPARALSPASGTEVRLVGFGETHDPNARTDAASPPRKRTGRAAIDAWGERDFTLRAAPSHPCIGDSGGPVLLDVDGVETVIGVVSAGDARCESSSWETRVDVRRDAFLAPFLAAHPPPPEDTHDRSPGCAVTGAPTRDHPRALDAWAVLAAASALFVRVARRGRRARPHAVAGQRSGASMNRNCAGARSE